MEVIGFVFHQLFGYPHSSKYILLCSEKKKNMMVLNKWMVS